MKDNRKVNERRFWEKRAINYDKRVKVFSDEYSSIIEQTKKYTHANSVVLDVACGTGIISLELAKYVRDIEGIDISPNRIAVAKEKTKQNKIKNVNFSVGDTYELNFPDEHFDIVLLANLLHVVKDPIAVLSEAKRVLKQEGILLLSVECSGEYQKKIILLIQRVVKSLGIIKYLNFFKYSEMHSFVQQQDLKILRAMKVTDTSNNYFIVASKINH